MDGSEDDLILPCLVCGHAQTSMHCALAGCPWRRCLKCGAVCDHLGNKYFRRPGTRA